MSRYLLDTDICVEFLRGRFGLKNKIAEVGVSNCSISEITVYELTYGAYKSQNFSKHIEEVNNMRRLFRVLPAINGCTRYAVERVRLEKLGLRIPDFDLLIGTTAVANNLTMITNNENHLSRIEGIFIENWIKESKP